MLAKSVLFLQPDKHKVNIHFAIVVLGFTSSSSNKDTLFSSSQFWS